MKNAKVICAPNVSDAAFAYICDRLRAQCGDAVIERETDPGLIGGFILLFDGKVYDMSLRAQMDALRSAMQ